MVREREEAHEVGYRAHNTLLGSIYSQLGTAVGYEVYERVQCLPLQTLLLALGITHVHFVSLDIEGVEEDVAQAFWGSTVTVDVWLVEHHNPYSSSDTYDDTFIKIFEFQGYSVYTIITELQPFNYVFIRQNSTLHDAAFAVRPSEFDFKHLSNH
ncbi:hypothetical protein Pcinc_003823 [Petrolisthes cinctipes]|uniref:Methyltransferase FkbM domain-containing protein n=1 Tax=Petrolisthes cinctipes TaxID=88211 RepID=A0AAE1GIJ4_PETCI|nr:hypothetical protein Pcinc_036309 [Petrolisthes cinctipes]KAK3892324.1 hypothetical protein Pcinc_003823 [Petrolisthes cinctipes]